MEQVVESFISIQNQINSLASVALQNRRAQDLLTAERSYKTFTFPKTCSNRYSLGYSLSWDHWYLSFYSSYLDPVSLISFKGFSKNGFRPSLEIRSRPFFFSRASPQAQKKETVGPRTILHSRPKTVTPIQQEVAREIRRPFFPCFMISGSGMKESLGPREENSSLKGPLLNHLTSERTKHNFSYILPLQASCIYLGLNSPCPETYHPLHPPRRLIAPCPTASVISTEEYSNPS